MLKLTKLQVFKILIVYVLLSLAALLCYNIKELLPPAKKRSFQCSDESLAKPFLDDTVPPNQLHLLGVYLPIVLIVVGELTGCLIAETSLNNVSSKLRKYALKTIIALTLFLIGLAVERLYKNVAKIKMARLRPNFITVCQPVNAAGYTCQGLHDATIMADGHTSLAAYSMVFLICYLHILSSGKLRRIKTVFSLVILIMQTLGCSVIIFVAMSRILDFKHHWSDVCAGFISGSSIALVLSYYLKGQLENIEEWLSELTHRAVQDVENGQNVCMHKSVSEEKETCGMELVSE